jgi:hypothetical protein
MHSSYLPNKPCWYAKKEEGGGRGARGEGEGGGRRGGWRRGRRGEDGRAEGGRRRPKATPLNIFQAERQSWTTFAPASPGREEGRAERMGALEGGEGGQEDERAEGGRRTEGGGRFGGRGRRRSRRHH